MQPRKTLPTLLRAAPLALLALAACGNSPGSAASRGAGYTPLRGGFPTVPERRVAHAVQVRVTSQALRALEPAAPDLLAAFLRDGVSVPRSDQTVQTGLFGNCTITVCPQGCRVPVALSTSPAPLELSFVPTEQVRARLRLVIPHTDLPVTGCSLNMRFDVDTSRGARTYVGIEGTATLRQDTHNERYGYLRPDVGDVAETAGEGIENEDFQCQGGGVRNRLVCGVINNFARDTIRDRIREQFATVVTRLRDALTQTATPDPPGCPAGLLTDGTRCFFRDQTPVPVLLGAEGQAWPGAILGSAAPPPSGVASGPAPVTFVLAAGDPRHGAEASDSGATLNMLAAVLPRQHSTCVPQTPRPAAPAIPEWPTLRQNTVPGSSTPVDVAVGISEDALNYGLWNLWDSGAFCYDAASPLAQTAATQLNQAAPPGSALRTALGLGAGAISLALRPQQPPRITVGHGADASDPLVRVDFPQVALDVVETGGPGALARTVTLTADLSLPVSLAPDPAGVRPALGALTVRNLAVANGAPGAAAQIESALSSALAAAATQYAGVIPALTLPGVPVPGPNSAPVGSVRVALAPNGVQGVTEGASRYLGLFGSVQYQRAGATATTTTTTTTATGTTTAGAATRAAPAASTN